MTRKWKILCLILLAANITTLHLLLRARIELSGTEERLIDEDAARGMREASEDFASSRLRVYEIQTHPYPATGQPIGVPKIFTGRKDGPFEIWTWPRYRQHKRERFSLETDSEFVSAYNGRMRFLHHIQLLRQRHQQTGGHTNTANQ